VQNQDLFWAVRGGGGGQFGVVTEYVMKTHPVPQNVVTGGITFYPSQSTNASENASWNALATAASLLPDLMDSGLTGQVMAVTKKSIIRVTGSNVTLPGVGVALSFTGYNMTAKSMNATINNLASQLVSANDTNSLTIVLESASAEGYWAHTKPAPLVSQGAGASSLFSSRLLGRQELTNISRTDLLSYLHQIMVSQDADAGSMLLFGLQGGPGPASTPEDMRGSVLPAWRTAYAHVMIYGASVNATGDPSESLAAAIKWQEEAIEPVLRNWAPNTGAYMNEGNAFSSTWKRDFYGDNYDRLLEIKRKYDPSESLFVWSGVGSDMWNYDLKSGLLCRTA
jgi:FAD/FMN-containing dehydrogenase